MLIITSIELVRGNIVNSMNIKKISIFLLLGVFVTLPDLALAQIDNDKKILTTPTSTDEMIVLSTVNIQDATINSQDANKFNISFNFSNKEIIQTGVRYGVRLVADTAEGQVIVDEKVYPETLTFYENSVVSKIIDYLAPENLTGEYKIIITLVNEKGFSIGSAYVDDIKLAATKAGIVIRPETCITQVIGESASYPYSQVVDIADDEFLILTCKAVNNSSETLTVVPVFTTYYKSIYGNNVDHEGGDTTPLIFDSNEEREISVHLPKASISQMYEVTVSLNVGEKQVSNFVSTRYFLQGPNASLSNVWLDKDFYKKSDEMKISVLWESRGGENLLRAGTEVASTSNVWLDVSVVNADGVECMEFISRELLNSNLSLREPAKFEVTATVINDCKNPAVLSVLRDENGNIFDQMSVRVESVENDELGTNVVADNSSQNKLMMTLGVSLLILVTLIMFLRKKKEVSSDSDISEDVPDYSTKTFLFALAFVAIGSMVPTGEANAITFCANQDPSTNGFLRWCNTINVNLDKSSYPASSNMNVAVSVGTGVSYSLEGTYTVDGRISELTSNYTNYLTTYYLYPNAVYGNKTITAPASAGNYNLEARAKACQTNGGCYYSYWTFANGYPHIPFSVTAPAVMAPSSAEINLNKSTALTTENFTATWSGNNSPTSYNVRVENNVYSMGNATSWTGTPSSLGLVVGSYKFYAQACNSAGCSPWSSYKTLNVTTPASVPAPTLTFTASPTSVAPGRSSTLTWTTTNATACTASGDWTGGKPTGISRMESTGALTRTKVYNLKCSGPGGSVEKSVTITVLGSPLPLAPTLTFTASPTSVAPGRSSTLTWTTTNATACTASGDWTGSKSVGTNKTESTGALTSGKTYSLRCTGKGGSVIKSVAVSVSAPVVKKKPYVVVCPITQSVEVGSKVNYKAWYWASERNKPFCNNIARAIDVTNETEWVSRNTTLFTVDSKGVVTGQAKGSASLNARYKNLSDSARVDVVEPIAPPPSPPTINIVANPNLIRSGSISEVVMDINSDNDLDCSLNGVSINTLYFSHTSNSSSQIYKFTTRPLANAQIVRVICEVRDYPTVSTTKETRINVVPYLQEI